jgi:diadenosine tetraphosphate (Ap4A) HIT family hydrolase
MSGDELDEADEMELAGAGPRLDAFDITLRARESFGAGGRPPLPRMASWPIFPFEADGLRARALEDPVVPEPPRSGEGAEDCWTCRAPDEALVWADDHWLVSMAEEPASLPAVTLHPRRHLDFSDLSDDLGAGLGVLLVRAQRALAGIAGVGRVHVYKWGDGSAHLHVILVARPLGMMQLRGMYLSTWTDMLPPLPPEEWLAMRSQVRAALAAAAR